MKRSKHGRRRSGGGRPECSAHPLRGAAHRGSGENRGAPDEHRPRGDWSIAPASCCDPVGGSADVEAARSTRRPCHGETADRRENTAPVRGGRRVEFARSLQRARKQSHLFSWRTRRPDWPADPQSGRRRYQRNARLLTQRTQQTQLDATRRETADATCADPTVRVAAHVRATPDEERFRAASVPKCPWRGMPRRRETSPPIRFRRSWRSRPR